MLNRITLALAGLLALAPVSAEAVCLGTNCYTMKDANQVLQSVHAVILSNGDILQLTVPGDVTGTPYGATNPMTITGGVTLSALPSLAAGTNVIGDLRSITGTIPLPTGAAKENGGNLDVLVARTPALGPNTKANAQPVTMATDQPAIPVSISSAVTIAGSLPSFASIQSFNLASALPAGSNAIGSVTVTSLPALPAGANTIGKVGLDQTTPGTTNGVVVNASALPTGAAQEAGGNLAAINGKLPSLGPQAKAASSSVTFATDIPSLAVTGTFFQATQPVSMTALPAFAATPTFNIGTMPSVSLTGALPAGANAIGTIGVTALPALAAGTNIVGKAGIDQTTPGTTNGVVVNASTLPTGAAQDSSVQAVSTALTAAKISTGTAGSPALQVLTVQPPASGGTTFPVVPQAGTPNLFGTGSIAAANAYVSIPTGTLPGLAVQITGTFVGTLSASCSSDQDATAPVPKSFLIQGPTANTVATVTTVTAPGNYGFEPGNCDHIRITATSYTSGTISVAWLQTFAPFRLGVSAPIAAPLPSAEVGSQNAAAGIAPATSTATGTAASNGVVAKNAPGNLYDGDAFNTSANAGFLVVINATAVPASGATIAPIAARPLYAATATGPGYAEIDRKPGVSCTIGCVLLSTASLSTYQPTLTGLMTASAR